MAASSPTSWPSGPAVTAAPFTLTLTGPAGGVFTSTGRGEGAAAEPVELELDAVEFCRSLAGRADAEGLLTTIVPF
ncbi:MAG: hypothetical protein M5U14_20870 [Acidimicrobiia bacterium]|nr:hypothetical protein [Acidimicrobiia bacterium]